MRCGLIALSALALTACASPVVNIPPPEPLDVNSAEFRRELAVELAQARTRAAAETRANVSRRFVVGWEMHYGYYLILLDEPDERVKPDFVDRAMGERFDAFNRQEELAKHVGERLICECRGVEWSFYSGRRFIVREAELTWVR